MDLVLIHQLKISVVCCSVDGVRDAPPDYLGDTLRDPLLDADCREAEDVLLIGFVLRVAFVVDLGFDGAVVGADAFGGRSRRCEHVFLLDVHG